MPKSSKVFIFTIALVFIKPELVGFCSSDPPTLHSSIALSVLVKKFKLHVELYRHNQGAQVGIRI